MIWYGMAEYGMVWYGKVQYGMVWYGMVWYGTVWYGRVARILFKNSMITMRYALLFIAYAGSNFAA